MEKHEKGKGVTSVATKPRCGVLIATSVIIIIIINTFSKKGKFSEEGKGVTSVATKPRCGVETLATTIQASLVRERERGGSGQKATKMSKRKK